MIPRSSVATSTSRASSATTRLTASAISRLTVPSQAISVAVCWMNARPKRLLTASRNSGLYKIVAGTDTVGYDGCYDSGTSVPTASADAPQPANAMSCCCSVVPASLSILTYKTSPRSCVPLVASGKAERLCITLTILARFASQSRSKAKNRAKLFN